MTNEQKLVHIKAMIECHEGTLETTQIALQAWRLLKEETERTIAWEAMMAEQEVVGARA